MFKKLRILLAALRGTRPMAAGRRPRFIHWLESLEERSVPATFTVTTTLDVVNPTDGKLSLREAITAANAHPGADTIIVPAGVYRLALTGADNNNAAGDLDVTGSTVFQGAGASATIIDGQQIDRVFDVLGTAPGSINVTFQGLTIRNGLADAGGGGGIRVSNANLTVRDSVVSDNRTSGDGGGISNSGQGGTGNVTLINSNILRNVGGEGGGLAVFSDMFGQGSVLNVSGGTIQSNTARQGGGLAVFQANLTGTTVSGNHADFGGGIDAINANLTNCTVSGNTAIRDGGGIDAGVATLTNSTVNGNHAGGNGGGIITAVATLTNSTISGNTAGGDGGGIHTFGLTVLNVTITANSAHNGGGVFLENGGTSNIRNTIVAGNRVDLHGVGPDLSGAFTSGGHNLIGDGSGSTGFTNGSNGDQVGTAAHPIDPRLAPLANNGGPTRTHALLAGSPVIDHGDNTNAPVTDQRGVARPRDGDGNGSRIVDIGAFER